MNVSDSPIADTIAVAAKRLSVSRTLLYLEIKAGRLISLKAGARTLISRPKLLCLSPPNGAAVS